MQTLEPLPHRVQLLFAEHFFDPRKNFVFFQPHMIVQKFAQATDLFRFNRSFRREPFPETLYGGAYLSVIRQDAHDFRVRIEPYMPRIRGQQHFLFFAKMHLPRLVPKADKLLCLPHDGRCTFFRRRPCRATHLQRLNQCEVVVLAKWVQTRMAFHCSIVSSVEPMK